MGIIKTHDDFKHPEGKIQLLNGNVLDCYPLEQAGEQVDNEVKLDTTGTYLAIGGKKQAPTPKTDEEKAEERLLFCNNAFRFLQYRNRIMSDSRMFLCPVPIQNGMAYTGTSGFHNPTLGVYLEWWLNCETALICDGIGKKNWFTKSLAVPYQAEIAVALSTKTAKPKRNPFIRSHRCGPTS